MARLARETQTAIADAGSLRLRAAWLYHAHGLTQKEVAARLGVARTTVIRLLEEATRRGEVQIWIAEGEGDCVELALRLEAALGLDEAVVVPSAGEEAGDVAGAVGLALGRFLSETIRDGMTVGVGWGRTLSRSLAGFRPPRREGVRVLSLLGGLTEARVTNPTEYAWRLASQLDAPCFLFPAPLLVDSAETRERLLAGCGLDRLDAMAAEMDLAVVSVGDVGPAATSLSRQLIDPESFGEIVRRGGVADVMCHFLDADGRDVEHPVNRRVMAVGLDRLAAARHLVLATGGSARAEAILAAHRRLGLNTLVTDEGAARRLLEIAAPA